MKYVKNNDNEFTNSEYTESRHLDESVHHAGSSLKHSSEDMYPDTNTGSSMVENDEGAGYSRRARSSSMVENDESAGYSSRRARGNSMVRNNNESGLQHTTAGTDEESYSHHRSSKNEIVPSDGIKTTALAERDDYSLEESRYGERHSGHSGGHNGNHRRSSKNSKRKKQSNIIFIVIIIVAACVLIFAAYKLISISSGYKKAAETYDVIAQKFEPTTEKKTTKAGETEAETETEAPFVWDYDYLLSVNPEAVGWIRASYLNYPIVHSTDWDGNSKYLYTLIDGTSNSCGTLFVDQYIPTGLDGMYSIVYGHNMDDGSMFATLQWYEDPSFYASNPEMDLYIGYNHYVYKVFAAFTTSVDSFVYTYSLDNEDDFNNFVANAKSMNSYDMYSGAITYGTNNIVTLSTCTNDSNPNYRYVVMLCRDHLVQD